MAAAATDLLQEVAIATATTLDSPGYTIGNTSVTVASTANMPTATGITFAIDIIDSAGVQVAGTYNEYVGTVATATSITNVSHQNGTNRDYTAGATTRVYLPVSAERENRLVEWGIEQHKQDGTHSDVTADSLTVSGTSSFTGAVTLPNATVTTSKLSLELQKGWEDSYNGTTLVAPTTTVNNGNRSYTNTYASSIAAFTSVGMRKRFTRTVTAPTQCADLESGSSQYFSRASGSLTGITFTDDFTCMGWVKLESYNFGTVVSRLSGTAGWALRINTSGQVNLIGGTASAFDEITSYQSLPLGKWVHVAAHLDISGAAGKVYIDGIDVPALYTNAAPTALVQAGDLAIGAANAGTFLDGKVAQVGVFDAILSAATIRSYASQTLSGSETNCVGAWTLNGVLTDSDSNANTLTANGGALATNADSPFADASNTSSSYTDGTTEFGIVTSVSTDGLTETIQVPEGCALPTSGGISAVAYSTQASPYGFPTDAGRWRIQCLVNGAQIDSTTLAANAFGNFKLINVNVPVGYWKVGLDATIQQNPASGNNVAFSVSLSTSSSSFSDAEFTRVMQIAGGAATASASSFFGMYKYLNISSATPYYLMCKNLLSVSGTQYISVTAYSSADSIYAELALL